MCRLRNIAMCDYQESVTIGQTHTHGQTDGQTDAGQSDPYVPLCFTGDPINDIINCQAELAISVIFWGKIVKFRAKSLEIGKYLWYQYFFIQWHKICLAVVH